MAKKPYAYAQLEAVALEMRRNKDMVFFYEYETPVATLPTGEVLDLVKEFGPLRTSGRGWAIDETWLVGVAVGVAAAGSIAVVRLPSMTTLFAIEYIYNQAGKLRFLRLGVWTLETDGRRAADCTGRRADRVCADPLARLYWSGE